MTSTVKIISHNDPVRVEFWERHWDHEKGELQADFNKLDVPPTIVRPEDGECTFHCTTTRELRIVDLKE